MIGDAAWAMGDDAPDDAGTPGRDAPRTVPTETTASSAISRRAGTGLPVLGLRGSCRVARSFRGPCGKLRQDALDSGVLGVEVLLDL